MICELVNWGQAQSDLTASQLKQFMPVPFFRVSQLKQFMPVPFFSSAEGCESRSPIEPDTNSQKRDIWWG